jgi:hypothetical protein
MLVLLAIMVPIAVHFGKQQAQRKDTRGARSREARPSRGCQELDSSKRLDRVFAQYDPLFIRYRGPWGLCQYLFSRVLDPADGSDRTQLAI